MNEQTRNDIIRRWHEGQSMRGIAGDLHLSRETVKRVVEQHRGDRENDPGQAPRKRRPSKVDAYEEQIRKLLARYPKITVRRLWEELASEGYQGGYSILCERVGQLRQPRPAEWVERFETDPGVQAQMDWAVYTIDFTCEGRRRVNLFSYLLGYSRRQYLHFTESQDFESTLRQHVRAFEHLGGVAATCLYDNMKVVVSRHEDGEPIYNPRFLAFATHYGYRPIACRVRRPQTKGKVEKHFDYVEKNLLNGREFRSLEHLNDVTAWWLETVADVRVHRTTKQRPLDRHAEEQPRLIPLPELPYEVAEMVYRVVDVEGFVSWRQNRYSVPWQATRPGQMLPVKITENEVIIYGANIAEIARHARLPATVSHQNREQKSHRPPRDVERRREVLEQRFGELGDLAVQFLSGLRQSQRHCWVQAEKVLALLATYRRADLLAALERAVRYGAFSLNSVQRILAVQAQPKTSLDQLAEESREHLSPLLTDDPAPPRPASEYPQLLFGEQETADTPSASADEVAPFSSSHDQNSKDHEQTQTNSTQNDSGEQDSGEQDTGEQDTSGENSGGQYS
jgi:transposase